MTTDNQRRANRHEREVASVFGGQVTAMSGAGWVRKHDVHTDMEVIECKTTQAASYSVKISLLDELYQQAIQALKIPVLDIQFEERGHIAPSRWVVIPEIDYLDLRDGT